ncbi:hypothetical protein SPBR_04359 [Sporothrix brasiliensis 5110]|uniref:Uncharacterized protein n=1 Tax=Sporothrix brasiliensis 5110 TaxID=1398154 RepID=A0A0C2J9S8_9PEZI|nr:uncharacterized protein SPBR_04359 [Sporothrix brasiliensis 5110]KIH93642.1 hypothetical protein SPBR_04359 [Sporothrix brasiliensis 5110]
MIRQKKSIAFWGFIAVSFLMFFYSLPYINVGDKSIAELASANMPVQNIHAFPDAAAFPEGLPPLMDEDTPMPANIPPYIEEDIGTEAFGATLENGNVDTTTPFEVYPGTDSFKDPTADAVDSTRTAVEQLMEDMDRNHATLEHEVLGLGHNAVQSASAGDGSSRGSTTDDGGPLTHTDIVEAHALWNQLNQMYENIKGAATDMKGFLSRISGTAGDAASRNAAELLAAAKAADNGGDIHKINLAYTTKRSVDEGNAKVSKKLEMREKLRRYNDVPYWKLENAKHRGDPVPYMKDTTTFGNNVYKKASDMWRGLYIYF